MSYNECIQEFSWMHSFTAIPLRSTAKGQMG